MKGTTAVFRRELSAYFSTPLAYVFIVIFLLLVGVFTFQLGRLFDRGQADLQPFFDFLPWLYLFLMPAVSMRVWAEERKSGTIELLLTLPVTTWGAVFGKFLAAWAFALIALALTFPLWITVNYLGRPDNGAILTGYFGAALMAGGFLAVGICVSAATRSQVIAFVVSVVLCLLFLLAGFSPVIDFVRGWAPEFVVDAVSGLSFISRFDDLGKGLVALRDVLYFASLIGVALVSCGVIIEAKKAE